MDAAGEGESEPAAARHQTARLRPRRPEIEDAAVDVVQLGVGMEVVGQPQRRIHAEEGTLAQQGMPGSRAAAPV